MSLDNGIYIINSHVDNRAVGRYPVEDLSLLPKRILSLPLGVQAPNFVIEKCGEGYKIRAFGAPTAAIHGKVSAVLLDFPPAEEWVITQQPQHGPNAYTVEMKDRSAGWVVDTSDDQMGGANTISVKPLISTKSLPPQFPPNSLFNIVRIDRGD